MPATPAWPPASTPRLFVDEPLSEGQALRLDGNAANYLANVMRMKADNALILFDDRTGSWLGRITGAGRRAVDVVIESHLKPREPVPDFWLCAAPIKRQRFDFMVEKACELGVARFVPVATERAVVDKVKDDRLRAHMIEAAEQCERNALPQLAPLTPLAALLADWPEERRLYFCDERLHNGEGSDFATAIAGHTGPAAVLIGPEGGFTDEENARIRTCPAAMPVSLGPRILRAETAALTATAVWMGIAGDWKG